MVPPDCDPAGQVLVVGLGNAYRRDDGAGLAVARRLQAAEVCGTTVVTHEGDPADLLELWDGVAAAFVVDAVRSGAPAGTVHRWELTSSGPFPDRRVRHSSHALSLGDVLELGRAVGRLPRRLVVVGIEAGDVSAGPGLTPAVEAAVNTVAEHLRRVLEP